MLGYERAESYSCCAAYGEGSGEIVFDEVECDGSEVNIGHCPRNELRSHDCTHSEDVGVKCVDQESKSTTAIGKYVLRQTSSAKVLIPKKKKKHIKLGLELKS